MTYLLLGNLKGQSEGTCVGTTPMRQLVFKGYFKPPDGRQLGPKYEGYSLETDGLLRYRGRMYIHENGDIRSIILKEAHRALYCVHPGVKKMYVDMRKLFFWVGMKRDVVHFVTKCLECQ